MRSDWENVRLDIMLKALRAKFSQNSELKDLIISTGMALIVEDSPKKKTLHFGETEKPKTVKTISENL